MQILRRRFDGFVECFHLDRFREGCVHSRFVKTMLVVFSGVAGDADDDLVLSGAGFAPSNRSGGLQSGHARHFFVEQQHIVVVFFQCGERLAAVGDAFDEVAALLQ